MRDRNTALRLVSLGPIEYGLTKFDWTPFGGNKAGILLRSIPGNIVGSMTERVEKLDASPLCNFTRNTSTCSIKIEIEREVF